ncbi:MULTISPECIES: hypothetical protein [Paenibacillus]|nr:MULTISPECIES: hypothetical protein [Paenibacillus]QYK63335.1 hypothetical protein KAI37_03668 [Paenibacillus sp. S25]
MAVTSHNIIFKLRLLWSLGLWDGFRRGILADTPFGVREYLNVIGNQRKN